METVQFEQLISKYCRPCKAKYFYAQEDSKAFDHAIHMLGFGFDGTASFRKGTRLGPDALRVVAEDGIESYSPYLDKDLTEIRYFDHGNLVMDSDASVEQQWNQATAGLHAISDQVLSQYEGKMLTLGGEHLISYGVIKRYLQEYPDLILLHLDAHADLRDSYLGLHYSHATVIRRILDHFGDQNRLMQYGIRSGTREEYKWMHENKTLYNERPAFLQAVEAIASERPIYLTLDLDYFDPGICPGTGTPEAGGEDFQSFISLLKILVAKNFVGCDVVELSPPLDSSGNSDVFATKVVREILLTMAPQN